jgi:hypothetical protein
LTSKLSQNTRPPQHKQNSIIKGNLNPFEFPLRELQKKSKKIQKKYLKHESKTQKKTFKTIRAFSSILKSQKSHFGSLEAST